MRTKGLILCIILAILDLAGLAALGSHHSGSNGPPAGITILGGVLGIATLIALPPAWRQTSGRALKVVLVTRIISAITAVPGLFVTDVPAGLRALAAVSIILTTLAVALIRRGASETRDGLRR